MFPPVQPLETHPLRPRCIEVRCRAVVNCNPRPEEPVAAAVEDAVATVGVDVNRASAPLLGRVAGLNKKTAAATSKLPSTWNKMWTIGAVVLLSIAAVKALPSSVGSANLLEPTPSQETTIEQRDLERTHVAALDAPLGGPGGGDLERRTTTTKQQVFRMVRRKLEYDEWRLIFLQQLQ